MADFTAIAWGMNSVRQYDVNLSRFLGLVAKEFGLGLGVEWFSVFFKFMLWKALY